MEKRGAFITFEGSEGAGKSTQIGLLAERLRQDGREVCLVREPGGTALGEDVRQILKHAPYGDRLTDEAELLLFAASRAQLVQEIIRPALAKGQVVLSDRFTDSTTVYQGHGRGLPAGFIRELNTFATGSLVPAMTVLLDLPAADGLERARQRLTDVADRMEAMEMAFYDRVCQGYEELAKAKPARFLVVDARMAPEEIAEKIWHEFKRRQF
ncbi:MAG: dTMP kinase [Puniceicoccales bacterium]|jgi:dTMP kinase|nr:dTMP kinase [Puniceicoccales bacterium]